jgi:hypothetical protein
MTAPNGSPLPAQASDPSDYIARHMHHFSAPPVSATAAGEHAGAWAISFNALVVAGVLFVVLVCLALLTDRRALFKAGVGMSFGQRLYVWWSCAWRQWLANSALFFIIGLATLPFLAGHLVVPQSHSANPGAVSTWFWMLVDLGFTPYFVALVAYGLLSVPLAGYMVQTGFLAHDMPPPDRFSLWHATLLGLTTYAWSLPGGLAIADVAVSLPHHVAIVFRAIFIALWGMYIVLPRQLRRIARFATPGA